MEIIVKLSNNDMEFIKTNSRRGKAGEDVLQLSAAPFVQIMTSASVIAGRIAVIVFLEISIFR